MDNPFVSQAQPSPEDVLRKRQIAQLLLQQSQQQDPTQMIGGVAIRQSPVAGLAKLFQAYASRKASDQADQEQEAIRQQGIQDVQGVVQALKGSPAYNLPEGQQGPTKDAVAPDPDKAIQLALASRNPMLNQVGAGLLGTLVPKAPKWTPTEIYDEKTGRKTKVLVDENNPTQVRPLGGVEAKEYKVSDGVAYDPNNIVPGTVLSNPTKDLLVPDGKGGMAPNQPLVDVKTQLARAGAPSTAVTVQNQLGKTLAEQVGPMVASSYNTALGAQNAIQTANSVIKAVDTNKVFTGPGATFRLRAAQIGDAFGITGADTAEKINNTRAAIQGLAQQTLSARKQLAGQGQVSDNEQKLLERAVSGNIDDMTAGEIKLIAQVNKRLSQKMIENHTQMVNKVKADQTTAPLANFFTLPEQAPEQSNTFEGWSIKPK